MHQTVILAVVLFFFSTGISHFRAFVSTLAHFNEDPQNEEVNKTFPELQLLTLMHFHLLTAMGNSNLASRSEQEPVRSLRCQNFLRFTQYH